jgi:hypothetical protein
MQGIYIVSTSIIPGIGELGRVGSSANTMTKLTELAAIGITGPPEDIMGTAGMVLVTIEICSMTICTFTTSRAVQGTAFQGTVTSQIMTRTTTGMDTRYNKRSATGCSIGMTSNTVAGVRGRGTVHNHSTAMVMAVVIKVTGMTTLTVLGTGRA